MLEFLRQQMRALLDQRQAALRQAEAITTTAASGNRSALSASESAAFDRAMRSIGDLDGEIAQLRKRIAEVEESERRRALVGAEHARDAAASGGSRGEGGGVGGWQHVGGGRVYARGDYRSSWVRDMWSVAIGADVHGEARERLSRNSREVEVDRLETRALSTGAGAGGEFAPPAWLVSEFVALARAARPTADRVTRLPLPGGISSVNVPKLLTGTATAQQATQNTTVQNTDATTGSVTAAIVTIAGQQVLSQQLIDQSGIGVDELLLQDLMNDYAAKLDLFVLNNNATNAKGLLQQTGTIPVAMNTAGTKLLFAAIANASAQVQAARFLPPDTVVMHPRRWMSIVGAADASNRPLAGFDAIGGGSGVNTVAQVGAPGAQGVVGRMSGLDVVVDAQIPTNLGAGTNQDTIIVTRAADQVLWEGAIKAEAFRETKADTLAVLLRVYNYAAFTANRFAPSTAIISGTGLITPAFDGS